MKNVFLFLAFVAGSANADMSVNATIRDHYQRQIRTVPENVQICDQVQVPVSKGKSNGSTGGVILGGIVGNAIGSASGIDGARTLGTVIGMVAGNEMSREDQIDHYRTEQRCRTDTTYRRIEENVYTHSTATFYMDGRRFEIQFKK